MKLAVFQKTSLAQNVGRTQPKGQQPLVLPGNPCRKLVVVQSKKSQPIEPALDACNDNINDYCSMDDDGNPKYMTLGEKEAKFLEAMASFYYDGMPSITDEEFDLLKDELVWSGSKVAVLSGDEQRFLEAQMAFNKGKPIMSNEDFDKLKLRLKESSSAIALQGPRCSIRTRVMYSDAQVDYLKLVALNLPASLLVLFALFSIDDLTGFEVTKFIELPQPWGPTFVWGLLLPVIYVLASSLTNLAFKDALVLKAKCPSCGAENTSYFGDIFVVAGARDKNEVACPNCKAKLSFDAVKRQVTVQPAAGEAA